MASPVDTETGNMESHAAAVHAARKKEKQSIKCVVWDLDNTVWDGTLLEDGTVTLRPHVVQPQRSRRRDGEAG
jgi:predicted enzyme involved in methoxymalonyl-ACP biosynthesis